LFEIKKSRWLPSALALVFRHSQYSLSCSLPNLLFKLKKSRISFSVFSPSLLLHSPLTREIAASMVHIIKSQNLASLKGKKQKPQKLSTANPLLQHARAQNENMSDQQQQQQQPGIILAANRRVPIPNSKYDDVEDKEKEESRPKITKKARTPKAQKQSKTSTTVKMTTVSSETDTDTEKEDAEDKKLVQPSKILIPQDGQQPKKWRLADQRR
jgi:hypothetical protein